MVALLKTLQRAANDFRPSSAMRTMPIVTLSQTHRDVFRDAITGLLLLAVIMSGAMLWSVQKLNRDVELKPQIVVTEPVRPPAKIIVKLEQEPVSGKMDLPPPPPSANIPVDAPQANAAYPDIVLPADSLKPDEQIADVAPAPDSAPAVAVVAAQINNLPALHDVKSEKSETVHMDLHPSSNLTKDQLLNDAHLLLESGDDQAALGLYNQLLLRDSGNRSALEGKMYALQRTGQYEQAVEIGHRLVQMDPRDQDIRANLVVALGQSYTPAAMAELQHMVESNPDNATIRVALARLLMRRGYVEEAFVQLSRATQIAPNNLGYRLDLAILYDQAGHGLDALRLYRQVLQATVDEDIPSLPLSLGAVRQRVQYLEAVVALNTTAP